MEDASASVYSFNVQLNPVCKYAGSKYSRLSNTETHSPAEAGKDAKEDSCYWGIINRNIQCEYVGNLPFNLMILGDDMGLKFAKKVAEKANEQHKDCRLSFVPVQTLKYGYRPFIFDQELKFRISPGRRQDAYFMYADCVKICIIIDPVSLLFDSYSVLTKINDEQAKILGMEAIYNAESCLFQTNERIPEMEMYVFILCNPEVHGLSKSTLKSFLYGCVEAKGALKKSPVFSSSFTKENIEKWDHLSSTKFDCALNIYASELLEKF